MTSSFQYRLACDYLSQGEIIAYPCEAVYGLGCDPLNPCAIKRLLELKARSWRKGLILLAASLQQLEPWVDVRDETLMQTLRSQWPGPMTWVLPAKPGVPGWLRGKRDTLAVRVTDHPVAAALASCWGGALVSTSANFSERPPARSVLALRRQFGVATPYVLPGRLGGLHQPTSIWDGQSGLQLR